MGRLGHTLVMQLDSYLRKIIVLSEQKSIFEISVSCHWWHEHVQDKKISL